MPNDSTPPVIPVGVTSRIGLAVSAVLALIAAVSAVSKGDHSEATVEAGAVAAVTLWIVLGGRFAQAHKATSPQPTPQGDPPTPATPEVWSKIIAMAGQTGSPTFSVRPVDNDADEEPGDEDGLAGVPHAETPTAKDEGDGGGA